MTRKPDNCYVFSAGGTTGAPTYLCYGLDELRTSQKIWGNGMAANGIGPGDRVANCFMAGAFWSGYLVTNAGLEQTGCMILPVTGNHSFEETVSYLEMFKANVVMGLPEQLSSLALESERQGIKLNVDKVYYAGTHMSRPARDFVKDIWRCSRVASMGYAAVETGPIGYQCSHCSDGEHHVTTDWCHVGRLDDGNIVVTPLYRFLQPVIRSCVGDLIEWVQDPCPCGSPKPKFKLLSRADGLIRMHGNLFSLDEVAEVLAEFSELTPEYQVELAPEKNLLRVIVRVETREEKAYSGLNQRITQRLANCIKSLGQFAEENRLSGVDVLVLAPDSIERISRTGKIRRLIDKRAE